MNYYAQGGQAHGLKSLTGHKIQTKDGVPSFGIGGFFQKNVMKPLTNAGMSAVKAVQNVPGIKQLSDVSTQAFKPIDQALVGLDKTVGKAIPGGWGTIAQTVAAMTPGMQPLAIGLGAANSSGVMRKGGSFNLQGALIGGATAYATSELGEYLRTAGPGAEGVSKMATLPESASYVIPGELGDIAVNSQGQLLNASGQVLNPATQAASGAINAAPTLANSAPYVSPSTLQDQYVQQGLQEGYQSAFREPSLFDKATSLSTYTKPFEGAGSAIYDAGKSVINAPVDAVKAVGNYDYSGALSRSGQGMSDTASGIKSVLTGNINPAATAAVKAGTTMAPAMSTAGTIYGVMSLSDQEAQLDYLKQQKAAGNIAQAEYDQAVAEIARQRDYASDVVSKNPFSTNPSRDTSIGDTYYGRSDDTDNLYSRLTGEERLYAVGGSIDDESGMDEARGMMQGNLQKGLFGKGYAAGGQIDMGNGYNPFANLPPMSGSLGTINQMQPLDPKYDNIGQGIKFDSTVTDDFGGGQLANNYGQFADPRSVTSTGGQQRPDFDLPEPILPTGLSSIFNQSAPRAQIPTGPIFNSSTYQSTGMGSNSGSSSGTYPGGYGGGSGGAFPLEGQYGIVKMAAGGMPPRFLSGGGDGMSDDIPATINGTQEARLADGEFVIPADVVSHLGNGSSKAGAKQLYSMMDKVRKARTGNSKQGKQINPRKYLTA